MSRFGAEDISEPLKNISLMMPLIKLGELEGQTFYEAEKEQIIGQYAYRSMHQPGLLLSKGLIVFKNWLAVVDKVVSETFCTVY